MPSATLSAARVVPPERVIEAVRARIAPLFPEWESARIELLVQQIAEVEWRYLAGDGADPMGRRSSDGTLRHGPD
jgi:hypothetical protein